MLEQAILNHVISFDAFVSEGLEKITAVLPPCEVQPLEEGGSGLRIICTELSLCSPENRSDEPSGNDQVQPRRWLPRDCRTAHVTYAGMLRGKFVCQVGETGEGESADVDLGNIPVMVRSKTCNLGGLSPKELIRAGEDESERGGYFILNGNEKVIRMLVMPRANYPMAVSRASYKSRRKLFTKFAVLQRNMRPDGSCQSNSLHYAKDGSCYLRFSHSREEWLLPLVQACKACHPGVSDRLLMELLAGSGGAGEGDDASLGASQAGESTNRWLWERILVMMQQQSAKQSDAGYMSARVELGSKFRVVMNQYVPQNFTDGEVGAFVINRYVCVHTDDGWQKLLSLCIMFQKLMGLVSGKVAPDNQDAMSSHELLLPGQLYGTVLKEVMEVMMGRMRGIILKWIRKDERTNKKAMHSIDDFKSNASLLQKAVKAASDISQKMNNFLATGNIQSRSGLDLMQTSGYVIVADKLNHARFSSHFAAVHRGQYFSEMKTTTVRKLLPETWGFLCPVHTPDGAPCGLLNHIANACKPVVLRPTTEAVENVRKALQDLGMDMGDHMSSWSTFGRQHVWVTLDGVPLGSVESSRLPYMERELRNYKVLGKHGIQEDLEIVCLTREKGMFFKGLYLFLGPGRVVRPVRCLLTNKTEWIGPLEQLVLNVAVMASERESSHAVLEQQQRQGGAITDGEIPEQLPLQYSHEELEPTKMLSLLACLTPFSNHNQSPRNMYQCQMLKQTMGTPYHCHAYRTDNKVYRVLNPQTPLVRTEMYDRANCNTHPTGTNAVVAVITYTGYDMEDAMIINKSSYERGFGHGVIYKTKVIEAAPTKGLSDGDKAACRFTNIYLDTDGQIRRFKEDLNDDGFPDLGKKLHKGDSICCSVDQNGVEHVTAYKDDESAHIEAINLIEGTKVQGGEPCKRAVIKLRYPRNPIVGDKFSSRHGQKGVMSILWPQEDMPFTEGGMTPDILFNPHGFPSRMTIGMLIESIAAKTAAAEGIVRADASTFRGYQGQYNTSCDNEDDPWLQKQEGEQERVTASKYFGKTLAKHGFNSLGTEVMYSGIHGTEIETEIFVGIVYYQRLRHLVSDKAQVRMRGPNDKITHQPVKGRKAHGGIRFGEMERDSLLAHGASFLLHDRLMRSSDYDIGYVCPKCGSILSPQANGARRLDAGKFQEGDPWECPACSKKEKRLVRCHPMPVPWVFRYLAVEMASMNVKMKINVTDKAREASLCQLGGGR